MIQNMKTKENRKLIQDAVQEALSKIEIPGVKIVVQPGVTYSNANFKMSVEAAIVDNNGQVQTTEVKHWNACCSLWGFGQDDIGKKFLLNGRLPVTLTGCKMSRRKYPLNIIRVDNGTLYKCAPEDLTRI